MKRVLCRVKRLNTSPIYLGLKLDFFLPPRTKFAKVMFLHLSVILFTGGVSASVHAGIHTPIQEKTPPGSRHPTEQTPLGADTPLRSACWEIQATSGWYTSYWNAYLFFFTVSEGDNCCPIRVFLNWNRNSLNSANSGKLINY